MDRSYVPFFAWRLLRAHSGRNLIIFVGIFLSTFLLTLFFGFTAGLRQNFLDPLERTLESEHLVVSPQTQPPTGLFNPLRFFQDRAQDEITPADMERVRALPEVAAVYTETRLPFPVATTAQIVLGLNFALDSTISGFTEEAVQEYLPPDQTFHGTEQILPVLISPLLIEIYNSTIAEIVPGVERKTREDFLGRALTFTFGEINYLTVLYNFPDDISPQTRRAKIVGFAPFLSPFTLAIPDLVAREMRMSYEKISAQEIHPHALLVLSKNIKNVEALKEKLTAMDFSVRDLSENLDMVRGLFSGLSGVLISSAGITFFLALLFLGSTLWTGVLETRKSIGIWQALGAGEQKIQNIFLANGVLVAGSAVILALLLAGLCGMLLNSFTLSRLPTFSLSPTTIFELPPSFIFQILCGAFLLIFLATFLPARRAAKLSPLTTLQS